MKLRDLLLLTVLAALPGAPAAAAPQWSAGHDYFVLPQAQHTSVPPGKVEVLEVFSYGCPGCNSFQPTMELLKKALPANAQLAWLPASFIPSESWPMFQRAYFTAQALGIAERTHQAMYDAVWKTAELANIDSQTHSLKRPQPTIEQAARFYARLTGVTVGDFLAAANSFSVEVRMRAADEQVIAMQVPSTPCIVVAGRYRVSEDIKDPRQLIPLVRYLVSLHD